ncbi:hypothetical protein HYU14_00490 [Candidatus Woesearchaeota archaeon]|nr:hypothetical protein [Candidatus Woesearchaeota archaeon]
MEEEHQHNLHTPDVLPTPSSLNLLQPKKKRLFDFEAGLIVIFSIVFLFIALGQPWQHKIEHEFPTSYLASDAFFHQAMTQYAKETGGVKWAAPWSIGGYEGVLDTHPPLLYHLAATLSIAAGIEVFDALPFLAVLSFLLAILAAYFIWRRSSKKIAMLALPAGLLMLSAKLTPLIFWGYWLLLAGIMTMLAAFWAMAKFHEERSVAPLALFFSATALVHQPEFTWAGLFFAGMIGFHVWKAKNIESGLFKKIILLALLTGILSFYSLMVFSKSFLLSEGFRSTWDPAQWAGGYPEFNLINLGIFGIIALAGIVFFLLSKKEHILAPLISLFCFLLGYLILLGFGKRAYAHRLFWFIYLSFFFGFAAYSTIGLLLKKTPSPIVFIASIILIGIFGQSVFGNTNVGQGIMNAYDWEGLQWISKNIPKESAVHYFYSDALTHNAPLYNSERVAFNIRVKPYIQALQSKELRRAYEFNLVDGYPVYLHPNGFFSFCYFDFNLKPKNNSYSCLAEYQPYNPVPQEEQLKDLCAAEYYYFDKAASQPALAQYNLAIRDMLLKNEWLKEVYSNPLVSIVENTKPGVDCFGNAATA